MNTCTSHTQTTYQHVTISSESLIKTATWTININWAVSPVQTVIPTSHHFRFTWWLTFTYRMLNRRWTFNVDKDIYPCPHHDTQQLLVPMAGLTASDFFVLHRGIVFKLWWVIISSSSPHPQLRQTRQCQRLFTSWTTTKVSSLIDLNEGPFQADEKKHNRYSCLIICTACQPLPSIRCSFVNQVYPLVSHGVSEYLAMGRMRRLFPLFEQDTLPLIWLLNKHPPTQCESKGQAWYTKLQTSDADDGIWWNNRATCDAHSVLEECTAYQISWQRFLVREPWPLFCWDQMNKIHNILVSPLPKHHHQVHTASTTQSNTSIHGFQFLRMSSFVKGSYQVGIIN